jgi:glucose dehydrogenase
MAEVELDVWKILFWLIIAVLLGLILWRVLGSSPAVETIALGLTALGVWLGVASMKGSQRLEGKLDLQSGLLKDIKDVLERKL